MDVVWGFGRVKPVENVFSLFCTIIMTEYY